MTNGTTSIFSESDLYLRTQRFVKTSDSKNNIQYILSPYDPNVRKTKGFCPKEEHLMKDIYDYVEQQAAKTFSNSIKSQIPTPTFADTSRPANVLPTDHVKVLKDRGFSPPTTLRILNDMVNEKEMLLHQAEQALKIAHDEIRKLYKEVHQLKYPEEEK